MGKICEIGLSLCCLGLNGNLYMQAILMDFSYLLPFHLILVMACAQYYLKQGNILGLQNISLNDMEKTSGGRVVLIYFLS